jgi:hypothetical protein
MSRNERKLTDKEIKRKEKFDAVCADMEQNGYAARMMTVSVLKANILAFVVMLPFAIVFALIFRLANRTVDFSFLLDSPILFMWGFIALLVVFVVVHELIHGLTWGIFAKSHFNSIEFGVIWNMLTPYCTCSEPLNKRQYLLGAAMPTVILGFVLALIAAARGSIFLLCVAEVMIFSGGGDFLIILKMLLYRSNGKDAVFYDHPTECGFVVFEKK